MKPGLSKDGSFGSRMLLEQTLVLQMTPASQVEIAASVSQPYVALHPYTMRSKDAELRETARDQLQWTNDAVQGEDEFFVTSKVIWTDDCSDASQRTNSLLGPSWANSARFQQGFQFNKVLGGSLWPCLVQHSHVRRLYQALRCVVHVSCFGRTEHTVPKHDRETCHTCSSAKALSSRIKNDALFRKAKEAWSCLMWAMSLSLRCTMKIHETCSALKPSFAWRFPLCLLELVNLVWIHPSDDKVSNENVPRSSG